VSPSTVERVIAAVVLAAPAWPIVPACASGEFRRAFPTFWTALLVLLVAGLGTVVAIAALAPRSAVWTCVAVAVAVLIGVAWHAATMRGRARGWPPGSLRPLALGPWFDRAFFLDRSRRLGSPFKTVQFARPMACFVGLAEGVGFLKAYEAALGSPAMPFGRFIPGGFLRHMPREVHAATKSLFAAAFARDVYEPLEPFVRATFRAELARMAAASEAAGGAGIPPRRHVQHAVFLVWMRLFFSIEPEAPERARVQTLYRTIDIRNPERASDRAIGAAVAEIMAVVRARHAAATGRDAAAPPSSAAVIERTRPGALDDPAVLGNLVYMAHTTWADVSALLVWVFRMLSEHGAWADRLRAERAGGTAADAGADDPLAPRIVMETLRLEQSEHVYRVAERDLTHGDVVIPRGWLVRLCVRESHQDPRIFADPERFDPDRFRARTYTRREYSPFGAGLRHACIGEGLAMRVATVFTEELVAAVRWSTVADGPYEYSAWRHWRPGSAWRVHVTPNA
jgi:cytochrome P450